MSSGSRHPVRLRDLLVTEFSGAWGDDPRPGRPTATVLRATDIDDQGHIRVRSGVRRSLPRATLSAKRLQSGDVLLETSGGSPAQPVGRVAYFSGEEPEKEYLTSNFFRALRAGKDVDGRYLTYLLVHRYHQSSIWRFQQQTTGIINLNTADYLDQVIDLPPLVSQRRTSTILDAVDSQIFTSGRLIGKLRLVREGLLDRLLRAPIDGASSGHLGDLVVSLDAGVSVNADDIPVESDQLGVLKTSALATGVIDPRQSKVVWPSEALRLREAVRSDSIIVSRMNTPDLVGLAAYSATAHPNLHLPDRLWQLKPRNRSLTDMYWLALNLSGARYRRFVGSVAVGTSGTMKNISKRDLLAMPLQIPPLRVQRDVSDAVRAIDLRIDVEEEQERKLRQVKWSLMDELLTSGPRVQ
jgi:type I restriction enzyme, S subunit